jgi:pyruvate carboxylase subunit B
MVEKGWEAGQDDEELFELAMHPEQYRAYKSGKAKADFEAELAQEKAKLNPAPAPVQAEPQTVQVEVNGERFLVNIAYGDAQIKADSAKADASNVVASSGEIHEIIAPLEGKFYFTNSSAETPVKVGDVVEKGDVLCYIESMKTYNAITADKGGKIIEIAFANSESVDEDDVLFKLQ